MNVEEGYILPVVGIILISLAIIFCHRIDDEIEDSGSDNEDLKTADAFVSTSRVLLWISLILFLIIILMHLFGEPIIETWTHLVPLVLLSSLLFGVVLFLILSISYINTSKTTVRTGNSIFALILTIVAMIISVSILFFRSSNHMLEQERKISLSSTTGLSDKQVTGLSYN